jgi:hypothetical protein
MQKLLQVCNIIDPYQISFELQKDLQEMLEQCVLEKNVFKNRAVSCPLDGRLTGKIPADNPLRPSGPL